MFGNVRQIKPTQLDFRRTMGGLNVYFRTYLLTYKVFCPKP